MLSDLMDYLFILQAKVLRSIFCSIFKGAAVDFMGLRIRKKNVFRFYDVDIKNEMKKL